MKGDQLPILGKAIDYIGYVDSTSSIAEVAGLLAEGGAVAGTATAVSWLSTALMPLGAAISIVKGGQAGLRATGMRAIAYATTAWAFDDPIPGRPLQSGLNLRALVKALRRFARRHRRYGYRRLRALLVRDGWEVNVKRVRRLCRSLGLQTRKRRKMKGTSVLPGNRGEQLPGPPGDAAERGLDVRLHPRPDGFGRIAQVVKRGGRIHPGSCCYCIRRPR